MAVDCVKLPCCHPCYCDVASWLSSSSSMWVVVAVVGVHRVIIVLVILRCILLCCPYLVVVRIKFAAWDIFRTRSAVVTIDVARLRCHRCCY